jgi:DNA-binding CsgD family transcriptional regulator
VIQASGQRGGRQRNLRPSGLSDREVEVLQLVAAACPDERSPNACISLAGRPNPVQHIYGKIGVSTRSAAAFFALEHDLLPARDS